MKKILLNLFLICFAISLPSISSASYLTDGSFETPALTGTNWQVFNPNAGAWDVLAGPGIEIQRNTIVTARHGMQYVELDSDYAPNSNSKMGQTITLDPGRYLLDFWYRARTDDLNDNGIFYGIEGVETIFSNAVDLALDHSNYHDWAYYSQLFEIQTQGDYTVYFEAFGSHPTGDPGRSNKLGGFIDNVSLDHAPVPEPATLFLLGLGLLGIAGLGRRGE